MGTGRKTHGKQSSHVTKKLQKAGKRQVGTGLYKCSDLLTGGTSPITWQIVLVQITAVTDYRRVTGGLTAKGTSEVMLQKSALSSGARAGKVRYSTALQWIRLAKRVGLNNADNVHAVCHGSWCRVNINLDRWITLPGT